MFVYLIGRALLTNAIVTAIELLVLRKGLFTIQGMVLGYILGSTPMYPILPAAGSFGFGMDDILHIGVGGFLPLTVKY